MANISPLAYVDPTARIADNVTIHPFAYIDGDVEIGEGCEIMPYTSILSGTRMGKNNKVYQNSVIGADPQDFRWKGEKTYCFIGDNNVIREHVIINRGIRPDGGTRIGNDCFIMAETHIGHDTLISGKDVIGNGVKIAGDAVVGECAIFSSGVILHEGSSIGNWTLIKGGCRISGNVPPFVIMAHNPASYFGVNAVILRKHGFTDAQIDDIAKAYRHVYQSGTSVFNALQRIEADLDPGEVRDTIVNFIKGVNLRLVAIPRDLE
ncbi:MAG: acyl-ACP--UDP-N-acetylglucosamine O-acyltransferase [Bacteroides sp.]|nr:acyl-ACP--UDP-N-acetylglucosamine O-acyltransferase [Bacteroides sp.]MBD5296574.1 acyl-ACP--UDP-N-acetylglucosamine O-acyltransferase [Bacteroides sp.]MBD5349488.1 acyl-ACP--UDP-N-acetylglucosamine O-acyltransferase [Bacteroides sp.]MBD5422390.1 acyl-ACP--UDP-N-acetylglucosamine O-acyltransferase [Bacteroides sp.]MDE6051844.1 acyl-ACP--UDP-N-acetylglucosamine O-acyltransferase [Paramuribaculum sp.]